MGTQQILLVVLGLVMVAVAIAVGLAMFSPTLAEANKDAIINDLLNIGQYAYRYKLTPVPFGGGGRVYTGFTIPEQLNQTDYAAYEAENTSQTCTFTATSKLGFGVVTAVMDSIGQIGTFTFSGDW